RRVPAPRAVLRGLRRAPPDGEGVERHCRHAAIGVGFYQTPYLWLFAAGASLLFWILEGVWKTIQYAHGPRIERLERAFREDDFETLVPFQIYESWAAGWRPWSIPANMLSPIVVIPH